MNRPHGPRLSVTTLLDPRPADDARVRPICGAVNIPFDELARRASELPPRHAPLRVAEVGPACDEALRWLAVAQRAATKEACFAYAQPGAAEALRLWRPNEVVEFGIQRAPAGDAADLACGVGRDAVHLKSRGWRVTALDHLPDALRMGRALEARYAPGAPAIAWREADLESEAPLPLQPDAFDLVVLVRFLHRPLIPRLRELLRAGGRVVIETFTQEHRARHGRPRREWLALGAGELRTLLSGYCFEHYDEAWREDGSHTARAIARRE